MTKDKSRTSVLPELQFIYDPMPEYDFLGEGGICFRERAPGALVDTLIVHSCFVEDAIINPVLRDRIEDVSEKAARSFMREWLLGQKSESLEPDPLARAGLMERNIALRDLAQHVLIRARRGDGGLTHYHRQAIKDIFQFNGVSAHYLVDRDGETFELVSPSKHCFHAGTSRLPAGDDMREAVNDFSIGVELMGTHTSGFTDAQYQTLASLTRGLQARYPLRNVFGHDHVAVPRGRKTDPWNFDWERFKSDVSDIPQLERFP